MLSKDISSTIFLFFGMTRPGIEPQSPGPLANTLPNRPMSRLLYTLTHTHTHIYIYIYICVCACLCVCVCIITSRHLYVSTQSRCVSVLADRLAFARPCVGFHRGKSLVSSSLLLQQYPACLARLILIVFVMGGSSAYSYFVGCYLQDLFNIARSILV